MAADPGAAVRAPATLPELAGVAWRPRVSAASLRRRGRQWTLTSVSHAIPLALAAIGLTIVAPIMFPLSAILLGHAWAIPELYANRGANVIKPRRTAGPPRAEQRALGLLGDLVDHRARELLRRTGLVLERGALGVWLVGEAGALLIAPGGRRVYCMCVRTTDPELADRGPHLAPVARAADRRTGVRHGGEPRLLRRALAAASTARTTCASGAFGRREGRASVTRSP